VRQSVGQCLFRVDSQQIAAGPGVFGQLQFDAAELGS
jgi:hypothetical protein